MKKLVFMFIALFLLPGMAFGLECYRDQDHDGHGDSSSFQSTTGDYCPAGYTTNSDDCDDTRKSVYPGAPELCDGLNNDCDSQVDEGCVSAGKDGDKYAANRKKKG